MPPREYFATSRQTRYSVLFALPLLLLYETLAAAISQSAFAGVRNGADVLLKTLFVSLGGRGGLVAFGFLLVGIGGWVVWKDQRRRGGALKGRVFGGMLIESVIYATIFGQVVYVLTAWLLGAGALSVVAQSTHDALPLGTQLVVSLGAGLYEEILFRVLLVSGLTLLALRVGLQEKTAVVGAVLVSALIFSTFHYIGPYGDPFAIESFMFRAIAGVMLSGLYVTRGFGIAAWTHALYDVGITLFG